jgi:hypothetical protein
MSVETETEKNSGTSDSRDAAMAAAKRAIDNALDPKKRKRLLTGKRTLRRAYWGMSEFSLGHHRSCKCGAVYDRSEHMVAEREISSFECAVCGATIENWNSAWVPRYRFIACPARDAE